MRFLSQYIVTIVFAFLSYSSLLRISVFLLFSICLVHILVLVGILFNFYSGRSSLPCLLNFPSIFYLLLYPIVCRLVTFLLLVWHYQKSRIFLIPLVSIFILASFICTVVLFSIELCNLGILLDFSLICT